MNNSIKFTVFTIVLGSLLGGSPFGYTSTTANNLKIANMNNQEVWKDIKLILPLIKKRKHLGYFKNEYDAHIAYQNELKSLTLWYEYNKTNKK